MLALALLLSGLVAEEADDPLVVLATVNGHPVYQSQVAREVERALQGREVSDDFRKQLEAGTLQQLINQNLVLAYLERTGKAASQQDVDLAVSRLKQELSRQEKTLEDHYDATGTDQDTLRRVLRWQISWERFLNGYLTDENLRRYFSDHRRDFDGTELHVAQILLKTGAQADTEAVMKKASRLRDQIVEGSTTFAQAARQHSQAPTAASDGQLGWIKRHEPMPESFSQAAFGLEVGEVSLPVTSSFGVHLIQCLEEKPGQRDWQEARAELRKAVTRYLFQWAAERERGRAKVVIKGSTS